MQELFFFYSLHVQLSHLPFRFFFVFSNIAHMNAIHIVVFMFVVKFFYDCIGRHAILKYVRRMSLTLFNIHNTMGNFLDLLSHLSFVVLQQFSMYLSICRMYIKYKFDTGKLYFILFHIFLKDGVTRLKYFTQLI